MTLLAKFFGIAISWRQLAEGSEQELVNTAVTSTGVVLIAWHHEAIPAIANLILQNKSAPQKWPGERFDMVWIFTRAAANAPWAFSQAPQLLLSGDSATVIQSS